MSVEEEEEEDQEEKYSVFVALPTKVTGDYQTTTTDYSYYIRY